MRVTRRRKKNGWPPSAQPKKRKTRPTNSSSPQSPSLRFTPYAWAKLLFLRDLGTTEIGLFAISAVDDPLLVEDVRLVRQTCSVVTVHFDDGAVADFFDAQVDRGLHPERFSRVWLHTHPGNCPRPSSVDEATFARVFGAFHWSVMFIIARGGATYARLQYRVGPGGSWEIPVAVDYTQPFPATDHEAWRRVFERLVKPEPQWREDDDFFSRLPPDDWPFNLDEWEAFLNGAADLESFRPPERFGADGPFAEHLGDGDRRRLDRPASGAATDGLGSPQAAVD